MPPKNASSAPNPRASHTIRPSDIVEVLCHRKVNGNEEFLIRWRSKPAFPCPPLAVLSWHSLPELDDSLHHIQLYLESQTAAKDANGITDGSNDGSGHRKRKLSDDHVSSRDSSNGLLTPANSAERSRSPSAAPSEGAFGPRVYNGLLQKKEGRITCMPFKKLREAEREKVSRIKATSLPTPAMKYEASKTSLKQAELAIRWKFLELLKPVKGVYLQNSIDTTTPSLNFTFVNDYVLRDGVNRMPMEAYEGCGANKCRPNMGQNIGCEYTQSCECLEYAEVDEKALGKYPDKLAEYQRAKERGEEINTMGMPKRFPYRAPKGPSIPQVLHPWYLEKRAPIYECNHNCNCGPRCKSRVVQKGRKVELTIFKTEDRGWGVYCNEDLSAGEFIDTYLGEIITNEETDRREEESGEGKPSYLYSLDKFVGDNGITKEQCYVVDGQYMGGPTRFINHSCEPNCRQYVVSYNKNDWFVYNLAFFAYENIPKGTELTFDYMDLDEMELEDAIRFRKEAFNNPENKDKIRCNCGAEKCRGFLW